MAQKRKLTPSQAVDQQLERYRAMRDFSVTAEPSGEAGAQNQPSSNGQLSAGLPFVIQKHAARRLHYDFRLGWRGVLKSWAVTKGPSYNPADKRLAVQVEDHPIEYGGFEGTIPQGQYGGGTVMIWDTGTWEPLSDVDEGLERGSLKFTLHGEKLRGNWTLVRMKGRAGGEKKANWLLIKERDEFARSADDAAITDQETKSAITGRDLDEIAANRDHVWNSKGPEPAESPQTEEKPAAQPTKPGSKTVTLGKERTLDVGAALDHAPKEAMPGFIPPQLALAALHPPEGDDWLHELKLDGYRIQLHFENRSAKGGKSRPKVQLFTRSGLDWTHRMPELAAEAERLPVETAILDGELVVLDEQGGTSFADLQAAFQEGKRKRLTYFVFDLLHLNGRNLRELALSERQQILRPLLDALPESNSIRPSEHVAGRGEEVFAKACAMGAEGVVSKRASDPYRSGRGGWLKIKCVHEQEFVIGGYTLPVAAGKSGSGEGVGALLVGYYEGGRLVYAGRCGTGFPQKVQRMLRERMKPLEQKSSPFKAASTITESGVRWVKPELVAQVRFSTWTSDDVLRQASFKGLREDKPAREVVREDPVDKDTADPAAGQAARGGAPREQHEQEGKQEVAPAKPAPRGGAPAVSNPDKVLDPESGLTKAKLADYYLAVADAILPYLVGRPLSLVRCPEGRTKPCFFQKRIGRGLPRGVESIPVPNREGGTDEYVAVSTAEGLVGLAQMGVLEIHPWGSLGSALDCPDRLIFDLDPDESIAWPVLAETAAKVRALLKRLKLESFLKTTGGKGLHVVAPIRPDRDWAFVKEFARALMLEVERQNPQLYIMKMTKSARKGRIYLDYLRNERGATAIAPYSPRARAGAPVALPLRWSELKQTERPQFHVFDFAEWKSRLRSDPWKRMMTLDQSIPAELGGR